MTGVFFDTTVICTVTGLAICCSGVLGLPDAHGEVLTGAALTIRAFGTVLGPWADWLVSVSLGLFAFTSVLGCAVQAETVISFLLGRAAVRPCQVLYGLAVFFGAVLPMETVLQLADLSNALMALPNLMCLILLSGEIACRKSPLAEACQMLAVRSEKPYGNWLWTLYASMTRDKKMPFCKIWEEAAEQLFTSISLPEAEQNELKRLGKKLGSSDSKMQEQALNWYGTQLKELESTYRMTLAEKQKLCRSLGILAGLFLAVLFI